MSELLPCPFCGGQAENKTWDFHSVEDGSKETTYFVECPDCAASGGNFVKEALAVGVWNNCVSGEFTALRARVEQLEAEKSLLLDSWGDMVIILEMLRMKHLDRGTFHPDNTKAILDATDKARGVAKWLTPELGSSAE